MWPRRTACVLAGLCLWFSLGVAASPVSERIARIMSASALQGRFHQQVNDANGRQIDDASGDFYFSPPNRFRWEYRTPYEQLIVADGETVWIFDQDLEQVTRRPQVADAGNDPMALLSHPRTLDALYDSSVESIGKARQRLLLTCKSSQSPIKRIVIDLAGEQLVAVYVLDQFGQRTQFSFTHMVSKKTLPRKLFHFDPPDGVEVVDAMTAPASSGPAH